MASPSSMAIGIVVALVLIAVAMLNRRKNPFFPESGPIASGPHLRARMRAHRRSRLTPVGVAYHEALEAHGRH